MNDNHNSPQATPGVVTGAKPADSLSVQVEKYLSSKYHFRINEINQKLEYKAFADADYQLISDRQMNSFNREMIHADIRSNVGVVRNTLMSDFTPVYNPINDYFQSLSSWDGQTDHIVELAKTVSTTNDALWHTCFKKWFVALVGCAIKTEIINHTVIVFSGEQGLGKTTWALNLLPKPLKEYCFSGTIDTGNKDTLINLSETMLINLDELENLNKADLGALKGLITKGSIRVRRPYGFNSETMPRRASFIGSVNGKEFLNDATGNRRFLCFEVINIDYRHSIDMDLVYAQALHLLGSGFQFWFNSSENDLINKNNEQFRNMSVEEELLKQYFEPCAADDADHLLSTTELLTWLGKKAKVSLTDAAKLKMGKALKALGFLRLKRQNKYVYALKETVYVPEQPMQGISTKNLMNNLYG
jgi:predicted P-loop ATPase